MVGTVERKNTMVQPRKRRGRIKLIGYISLALTVLVAVSLLICTFTNTGRLEIHLKDGSRAADYRPENGLVELYTDPEDEECVIVKAKKHMSGKEYLVTCAEETDYSHVECIKVMPGGMIYDYIRGNFSGWKPFTVIVQVYVILIAGLLMTSFVLRCRSELFSYKTLFFGGIGFFLLSMAADVLINQLMIINTKLEINMMNIYSMLRSAGSNFMILTLPIMAIFALSLTVSNFTLIKREGKSFVNILGLIMTAMIVVGYVVFFIMNSFLISGSEKEIRIFNTAVSVYSTVFVYFEDMLLSASLCGVIAARKKPSYDKTHIIILGCGLADDGTPLPLLRKRIDRALAFSREQKAAGGGDIKFVPSGGQGADEVISEAESMKNYLIGQGIGEDMIIPENKSTTTQENMRFSLEKIMQDCKEPRIIFSTSGYHVLRSGMISRSEGLDAEGIGGKTGWYFFPNAFVREFAGLLARKRRQHAFWILFFIIVFAVINFIMPI